MSYKEIVPSRGTVTVAHAHIFPHTCSPSHTREGLLRGSRVFQGPLSPAVPCRVQDFFLRCKTWELEEGKPLRTRQNREAIPGGTERAGENRRGNKDSKTLIPVLRTRNTNAPQQNLWESLNHHNKNQVILGVLDYLEERAGCKRWFCTERAGLYLGQSSGFLRRNKTPRVGARLPEGAEETQQSVTVTRL